MKDNRKDLRIRLPKSMSATFEREKQRAERELGVALRDNEFAARVLVQALKEMER